MIRRLCALAVLSLTAAAAWGYDNIKFLPNTNTLPALKPTAVAASEDRLYVLDEEQGKLGIYSEDGKPLAVVGSKGSGSEAFSSPKRLAVGPDGTVFVADTGNSRVQMLDPDGKFIGRFGTSGSGPGQLDSPEGVAVGQDGRVYVADTDNHRVQVFTREGVFLFGFGTKGSIPGTFNDPGAIHVDASDNLYVLDEGNDRIQKFDARTRFVKQYPLLGQDLALDAFGFLYMLEPKRGKVKEVNPEGSMLGEFGSVGAGPGQFKKPGGVAIASNGDVLVADTGNGRVSRIELATKTKTTLIPPNLAMKLFVAGPTSVYPYPAAALAASGDKVYAYLSKAGNFVALDVAGEERLRFGKKQGKGPKDPTVTKGTKGFAVREPFGIFVADTESDRMQVFTTTGGFASEFAVPTGMFGSGREGRLSEPTGVAVTEKGTIYVADTGNRRISVFSPEGAFLSAFSQIGPHELRKPVAVAFDEAGYLFVLDRELKKVFKCEPSGGYVAAWGEGGSGVEQFSDPVAMAFDGRTYLYVLDQGNPRVLVFDKDDSLFYFWDGTQWVAVGSGGSTTGCSTLQQAYDCGGGGARRAGRRGGCLRRRGGGDHHLQRPGLRAGGPGGGSRRRRVRPAALLFLQRPYRLFRGDLQDARGAADLGEGDARPLPCERSPLLVDALSHPDGRLLSHRPAALQQRRPDGNRSPGRGPRRDPVAPHQFPRRGPLPPLRPCRTDRAPDAADHRRRDRGGQHDRSPGRLLFRGVPDERDGGEGLGVHREDRRDGGDDRRDRQGVPPVGDRRCGIPLPAADRLGRESDGRCKQIYDRRKAGDPRRRHRRAGRGGADRPPDSGKEEARLPRRPAAP